VTSPTPSVPPVQLSAALVSYAADAPDGWETMLETARLYDRVGIDRLVVSDHVVFGEQLDAYGRPEVGGQRGGRQPTGPDGHWLEPELDRSIPAMRERIAGAGGSPDDLQVVANLRIVKTDDGTVDVDRTMAQVPRLVAAGATDLRVRFAPVEPNAETEQQLRDFVGAFRVATGQDQ
jgi:hypothetical protein